MKKLIKLICIVSCLLVVMTGCGKSESDSYNESQLKDCLKSGINVTTGFDKKDTLMNDSVVISEDLEKVAVKSWNEAKISCGNFDGKSEDYDLSVSNGEITLTETLKCDKRDVNVTATFEKDAANDDKMTMTSLSYDLVYTIPEKLEQAAGNTLMGMGTVFCILIFISLLISCFKFIPKFEAYMANRKNKTNSETEKVTDAIETPVETVDASDDTELIAVIAAAIAASENTTTDGFVVRSIRRR